MRDIDNLYIAQSKENIKMPNYKKVEKILNRCEFLDLLLRMSIKKYYQKSFDGRNKVQTKANAIEIFMENDLKPIIEAGKYEFDSYRKNRVYMKSIDNVLVTNENSLIELYNDYKSNESMLTLKGLVVLLNDKMIEIKGEEILKCFVLSKMLLVVEANVDQS